MNVVFAHLAEIQPFLKETRNILKEVVARTDNTWIPEPESFQNSPQDRSHDEVAFDVPVEQCQTPNILREPSQM